MLSNRMRFLPIAIFLFLLVGAPALADGPQRMLRWETVVDAPVADVWAVFTTREGIESWMVPVAEVDFRVGGTIRTNYNPEARAVPDDPGWIAHHILAVEPMRMYSARYTAPSNAPVVKIGEKAWGVTWFEEIAPGRTRVEFVSCGWGEGLEWDEAEAFFQQGNAWTIEQLRKRFSGEKPAPRRAGEPGRALVHEVIVEAPLADAWAAWSTADGLKTWLTADASVDLRPGGVIASQSTPGSKVGDPGTIEVKILSYQPMRMLAYTTDAPPMFPEVRSAGGTWAVVTFDPVDEMRTRVRTTTLGWRDGEQWDAAYDFFKQANDAVLDRLRRRFDADEAMALLDRLAGGEWIHEGEGPGGAVFRVRNVITRGPDGRSLVGRGWLGGESGMVEHGATQIWIEPASEGRRRAVRFQTINENGDIARGEIFIKGGSVLYWDWTALRPSGAQTRFLIVMNLRAEDEYTMGIVSRNPGAPPRPGGDMVFRRVDQAPATFRSAAPTKH